MFSPEVAEPSTSTAAIFGPFTHLKPQHILTNGKETSEKRADDVCSDSSGKQESLLRKLSSDVKRIRKEKEESFTKFSKMTKELIMLQKTAMSVKITSSMEAEAVFALLEKPKPPEPKPQKPQRMMGRRGQLSEPKPQATEPPPETSQQPAPAPTPSLAPEELPAAEPPIERPTPTPTPKLVPTAEGPPEKPKIERPTIRVNRPLFYPLNSSTPPQPAPVNSTTPTPQPASTPILNGGINGSGSPYESPLSTPPVAINKGKRRAAATTAAVAVSANSVTERPEKRPKRDVKKKLISKQITKVVKEAEETYCSCERISFGEMVACDNENCSIQWFHFECVQLTVKPKGKWFCPDCRQPDNERLPRSTTPQPIMKSLPVSIMKSEQDLKAYPHPAQAQA